MKGFYMLLLDICQHSLRICNVVCISRPAMRCGTQSTSFEKSLVIELGHPLQGGEFHRLLGFHGARRRWMSSTL